MLMSKANQSLSLVHEFWLFLKEYKPWWIMPIIGLLALIGALTIFFQGTAGSPFLYSIF